MRAIFIILLTIALPNFALALDTVDSSAEKPKVGQAVADFNQSAKSSAKAGCYFVAGLLLIFGVWKKYGERKSAGQPNLINIVSKTQVGPRAGLLIAEVEGERFLLSQTPDNISFITKLNADGFNNILEEELVDEKA